jgi:hypothetical protein
MPEQLPLAAAPLAPLPVKSTAVSARSADEAAKVAIARRAKPSGVPGHVKLVITQDIPRALAERLSARAIRQGKNLEAVVIEILDEAGAT